MIPMKQGLIKMAKENKEKTPQQIMKGSIYKMLESLIVGNPKEASEHLHSYLPLKTRELMLGEKADDKDDDYDDKMKDDCGDKKKKKKDCKKKDDDYDDKMKDDDYDDKMKDDCGDKKKKVDEQDLGSAFSKSGSIMSTVISGNIKFENGGKKTLKKHGNSCKELDDDKVGKTKFKSGGKQPAKTLEKTPKPEKFDDGRDKDLGTTKS